MKFDKFTQDLFVAKFELSPEISYANEAARQINLKPKIKRIKLP
ncbi:hypothetical protein [Campylobacter showae]|nr:hypothetical protein [Campylobacter showae]